MLPALHHPHHPSSSSSTGSSPHHHPSERDLRSVPPSAANNNNSPRRHTYTTCHSSTTDRSSNNTSGRSRSHSCHSYNNQQQEPYEAMMASPPPPICKLPEASPLLEELFSSDATMLNLTPDTVEAIMMSLQIEREEMQLRQENEERATRSLLDNMLLEEARQLQQQQGQPQQQQPPQRRRRQVQFQVQDSESIISEEVIDEEEPLGEEHIRNLAFSDNGASFAAPLFRNDDFLTGGVEDLGRMIMPMPCDSNHNSVTSQGSTSQDKTPPKYYSHSNNGYDEKVVLSYKSSSSSVSTNGGDHNSCNSSNDFSIKSSEKILQGLGDLKLPPPTTDASAAAAAAAAAASNATAANRTINKHDCQCLICHRFAADHRELRFKMLTPCGHVFCKTCVQDFLVKKKKCPYCRHPVTQRGKQQAAAAPNSPTASPPMAA